MEDDVRRLARRIADAGRDERARLYHLSWWTHRLLAWAMDHPSFRTQLFRFIDVVPACRDDQDVIRHLEEYFEGVDVPTSLDLGLEAAEHVPFGAHIGAAVVRRNVRRMARQFIAGETAEEAMSRLRQLWRSGEAATVDLLGERTVTRTEAARYEERVHQLLDVLAAECAQWPDDPHLERDPWGPVARANVSVKPSALTPLYEPLAWEPGLAEAGERLARICEHAGRVGAALYVDMESYDAKEMTLELVRRLAPSYPSLELGCVVQAYLRDSCDDLRRLVAWAERTLSRPMPVRLVKGAYWDYETIIATSRHWPLPTFERKVETDANFERCTRLLIDAAGVVRPAFGTHNLRSIAYALTYATHRCLHETAVEIQLLYGMAEPVHAALRRLGVRVRAYVPVGELVGGMAYLVRRLLENTSNESFLRRVYAEARDLEQTIEAPEVAEAELGPRPRTLHRPPTDASHPSSFSNEPPAEFRVPEVRAEFGRWVSQAASAPPFEVPLLIGGRSGRTQGEIVSVNPSDPTRVVCRAAGGEAADVERAVAVARRAQPTWAERGARQRAAVLFRAAARLRARRFELAALEVVEAGKPWAQADADVCEAIDFCEYYGRQALALETRVELVRAPGERNLYGFRPRGVVGVISPWNFPLAIPCGMVTAALVTGNAVVFKPAEQTPGVALRLVEALYESGVPPGVLALVPGTGEEAGAALVEHPDVSVLAFTGSMAVGTSIIERAARVNPGQRHVKRVVAEMGGKNAVIVDTDADLDATVPALIDSAFGYAGQKCSAASRVIGVGPVFDELVDRFAQAAATLPVGPASDPATVVGPLIDADAYERVRAYCELARKEGEVVLERDDVPSRGWFVGPVVVVTTDPAARIATEEIFGPLCVCLPARDVDHAIELANATPYALTGGVFSRSPSRTREVVRRLRAGNIYVNRSITGALVGRQPFGGYGLSGVGSKAGGPDYLPQFCDPYVLSENTIRQGFAPEES